MKRHKPHKDWTVEDHLRHQQDGTEPVSDDYREAAREALEDAGLEVPPELQEGGRKSPAAMTAADHAAEIRRAPRERTA
ncbi:MAG TPA: hypothetical protein VHF88_07700 [Thermoleophilaceae bacterium]|nr:hypothetical protein [Thermoleophilaceae bacterium]